MSKVFPMLYLTVALTAFVPSTFVDTATAQPNGSVELGSDISLPSFEVASIKPNRSGDQMSWIWFGDPNKVTELNVTTKKLLEFAYDIKDHQLSGGPSWIDSEKYDINAKVPDSIVQALQRLPGKQRSDQLRLMVQSLLAERFNLKVSRQTKILPVFELIVSKNGLKLTEDTFLPSTSVRVSNGKLTMSGTMASLADVLSQQLQSQVTDKTGISGVYDVNLEWMPEQSLSPASGTEGSQDGMSQVDRSGPSIFTAIQEQLGLKLESTKGPVDTIVIDHIDRPSSN